MRFGTLLERCLAGNHQAWEEFAKRYGRLLEFSARRRLERFGIRVDELQMEEIVQRILVHLWEGKKLAQIRDEERITAWLAAVAGNRAISYWRSQNREMDRRKISLSENLTPGEVEELSLEATLVAEGPSPREEAGVHERDQRLHQALLKLSEREQLVTRASYFLNQTHEEIAQMLGLSRNNVSSIIDRAKKKLRQLLKQEWEQESVEKMQENENPERLIQ